MKNPISSIQLLIKPVSDACNLACEYCFYRGRFGSDRVMSAETLSTLVRSYMGLRQELSIFSWQGGEPTLAGLDFFREVVRLQGRHGSFGQAVGNSLQTNGILLDREWAVFLNEYRFLVGLSIDGPAKIHDRYRSHPGRGGSHAQAMKAAGLLREREVPFSILAAVHKFSDARTVYNWMRDSGFDSLQFIPIVESGPGPGRMADFTMEPEQYGEFLCELFDLWWPERAGVYIRDFESLAAGIAGSPPGMCLFEKSCGSYVIIEADGRVYPCDFFVREDMCLGGIMEASLPELLSSPAYRDFARGKEAVCGSCRSCEWLSICAGGCQKDRERGGWRLGPSYLCEGNRTFFRHAVDRLRVLARERGLLF